MVRSRRSPEPPSWLTVVESASAAFTGTARVVADAPAATAARGTGYRVTAEIEPGRVLFGAGEPVTVQGETSRPPERRLDPDGPAFPPDSLREVPYWDQARSGRPAPVLCVLGEPPVVRTLIDAFDDLPFAVEVIRGWAGDGDGVESSLRGKPAICYVAGFELLLRTESDVPGLVGRILRIPERPGGAVRGILALLPVGTTDAAALARVLLDVLAAEQRQPEAVVALLSWFDANRGLIAGLDGEIRAEAERVAALPFERYWQEQVARSAAPLTGRS
ncbi:hypothetical protein [Actinoplanes sp. NBRC 103695]|uniref:hypothetical protein n=1 Tax=Actinoplanes sp. NBRC 103695 TaxID=3032202 RepID=UPI0024A1F231|nr:hypothetical protein [Actinoplanes sp. NBRC 103695]GLY99881.1 hypothetical protein Acsp02_71340 [Actinoplanes sp. NBRC 103695]